MSVCQLPAVTGTVFDVVADCPCAFTTVSVTVYVLAFE
jgi:hypothetical protein